MSNRIPTEASQILDRCRRHLSQAIGRPVSVSYHINKTQLTTDQLKEIIESVCRVSWDDVLTPCRKASLARARQLFSYFSSRYKSESLKLVSELTGRSCHTSALKDIDKIRSMISTRDALYMPLIAEVEVRILNIIGHELKA